MLAERPHKTTPSNSLSRGNVELEAYRTVRLVQSKSAGLDFNRQIVVFVVVTGAGYIVPGREDRSGQPMDHKQAGISL